MHFVIDLSKEFLGAQKDGPSISGGRGRYGVGDFVDINCTSAKSQPPAELHWYINDREVCIH